MKLLEKYAANIKRNRILFGLTKRFQLLMEKRQKIINGKNNRISNNGVLVGFKCKIVGDNNYIEIKKGTILLGVTVYMYGSNHLLIIGDDCWCKGVVFCFEDVRGSIVIGKNTTMEPTQLAVTEPDKSIVIGKDCQFSYGIEFRTGDSHSIIDLECRQRINYAENIEIGDHVWIGAHAKVLKGVKIGSNSIISTSAVVTKSIPENSIAAGVPAKVIRTNVDWLRKRIYTHNEN